MGQLGFANSCQADFLTATDCLWVKARYCNLLAGRMIYFQILLRMEKFFQSYSKYHCLSLLLYRQWSVDQPGVRGTLLISRPRKVQLPLDFCSLCHSSRSYSHQSSALLTNHIWDSIKAIDLPLFQIIRAGLFSIREAGRKTLPFFDPDFLPHPKKMEVGKANSVYSQNGVLSLVCDPGKSS